MATINTPTKYSDYSSVNIDFTTSEAATSRINYTYTDPYGIARAGVTAKASFLDTHNYVIPGLPRNTTVSYTITATFQDGSTATNSSTISTKNPTLFANVRTASLAVGSGEISLRATKPSLFRNPRFTYLQLTVSADTGIRFGLEQSKMTLKTGFVYNFRADTDVYLTGTSTVNLALMENPNY